MRGNALTVGISLFALVVAGSALWIREDERRDRALDEGARWRALEDRIASLERRPGTDVATSAASTAGAPPDGERSGAVVPGSTATGVMSGGGGAVARGTAGDADIDAYREVVRRTVREELANLERERRESGGGIGGGEKDDRASLATVAAQLGLDEAQRQAMERELRDGQEAMLALLKQPASDGTVFADRIADAFLVPQERMGGALIEVFAAMAATEVPGTGQTYALRAEGVQKTIREALKRELPPDRYRAFEALGKDPTDIEIPESPWMEILAEAHRRSRGKDGAER